MGIRIKTTGNDKFLWLGNKNFYSYPAFNYQMNR